MATIIFQEGLSKDEIFFFSNCRNSQFAHFISILACFCVNFYYFLSMTFFKKDSEIQDGGSNDIITKKMVSSYEEQAQGYLINENLYC